MSDEGDQNWLDAARDDHFSAGPAPTPAPQRQPQRQVYKTPGLHGWFGFESKGRGGGINLDHVVSYEVIMGEYSDQVEVIRLRTVAGTLVEITDDEDMQAFTVRENEEYGA